MILRFVSSLHALLEQYLRVQLRRSEVRSDFLCLCLKSPASASATVYFQLSEFRSLCSLIDDMDKHLFCLCTKIRRSSDTFDFEVKFCTDLSNKLQVRASYRL